MREEFKSYGLNKDSIEFIGHAIALNLDDSYLDKHPRITFDRIFLYVKSLLCFEENRSSPYIYPLYGLSELSQAFARKAAIHGTVYMLNTEVKTVTGDEQGFKVCIFDSFNNKDVELRGRYLIGNPGYFPEHVKTIYQVIRCICIVKGVVSILGNVKSAQVIFLASDFERKNDIFLAVLGKREYAAPEGYHICIISTVKETIDPSNEVEPIVNKLGNVVRKYLEVKDIKVPTQEHKNIFISKGVDQTTHFESLYDDIFRLSKEIGVGDIFDDIIEGK
jgi:Rab GDP dissociation inhibitor